MSLQKDKNTFNRVRHHLRSSQIDEKLELLSEIPTNSTSGMYLIEPEKTEITPATYADLDLQADDSQLNGTDTSGLFGVNGEILVEEPPGDTSYILGPMISVYFSDGDYTALGYVQENTRFVVNLARISGNISNWDGQQGFVSYSQLTLEQAQWYKQNYSNGDVSDYRVFYSGVFNPQSEAEFIENGTGLDLDEFGRWLGKIIDLPKELTSEIIAKIPAVLGGPDPNLPAGSANPLIKSDELFGTIGDIFKKIGKGPEEFFPKGTLVGDAIRDATKGGIKHPIEYNSILPIYLGLSILTGQKLEIPISPVATKNMVKKIDANALSKVLKINTPTPTNARETINPSPGKTTSVIKDPMGWGIQGGLTYNYNTKTSQLEITSNKTLRTTSGGETVKIASEFGGFASPGKITSFTDVPSPSISQVQDVATELISAVSTKLGGPGLDPNMPLDYQLKSMRDIYNSNDIARIAVELGLTYSKTIIQGATSNIVALRKVLVDNGIVPKSDVEKIGGAYGQVSNVHKVSYNDLPSDVKKVIDQKVGIKESVILTEGRQKILKDLKKPYQLPEKRKEKIKHRPKVIGAPPKKIDAEIKDAELINPFKKPEERLWGKHEKIKNSRKSQERKNMILDSVGTSEHAWEWITEKNHKKSKNVMYSNFNIDKVDKLIEKDSKKIKNKIISKEQIGSDYLIKMYDDDGQLVTLTQSVLNERLQKQFELDLQKTSNLNKDPLFKRLKNKIDYPDKPSKMGYPDQPPPKMINGWHPEYGNRSDYYKKLDPISANVMNNIKTDNLNVNFEVEKQTNKLLKVKNVVEKNK